MSFLFPPPPPAAIVIVDDGGGVIADYRRAAIKYNLEGREVRIAGSCRSACLLALSVKKVCVWPEAEVKDHLARKIGAPTNETDDEINRGVLQSLPPRVELQLIGHKN